jgi:hypothetical protein
VGLIQHPAVQVVQVEQLRLKQPVAPSTVPSSGRKPNLPRRWEKLFYVTFDFIARNITRWTYSHASH